MTSKSPSTISDEAPNGARADPLVARIARTIERHGMLDRGDRVLAGVSGGADSVAMLDILHALGPRLGINLAVAHLNHGLRPAAADQEATLVRRLADRMGLPFYTEVAAIPQRGTSLEEALRQLRYTFFERTAATLGCTKIAVGHHADDNAEAVLLHLLRGSGLRGLAGIPPVRDGRIVRPLIDVGRDELRAYLQRRGLSHIEDPSNADPRFDRNKIRHHLLPLLRGTYNPNMVAVLNRLAMLCREEDVWWTARLAPLAAQAKRSATPTDLELDPEAVLAHPPPVRRRILRAALETWQGHLRRIGVVHIESVLGLLPRTRAGQGVDLPFRVRAQRTATALRFHRAPDGHGRPRPPAPPFYSHTIAHIGARPITVHIPETGDTLRFARVPMPAPDRMPLSDRHKVLFDLDGLTFPLVIRTVRPGDRLRPMGLQGTQKVKKILHASRTPLNRRRQLPVVTSHGTILWVAGVRRSDDAPLSPTTTRVLQVEWITGGEDCLPL
ncbi:MAG: tRNA lysidine(34) synthetase TilS [Desulfatitalea sp.]|nr:tRNA lysidine(34) synthetase TilS [Desulfatitalea sp.]